MNRWIKQAAAVATLTLLALATPAQADTLTSQMFDGDGTVGAYGLTGSYNLTFTGEVGTDTASLTGTLDVNLGNYTPYFGPLAPVSATLTGFHNSVTGANGIVSAGYGGDIFKEIDATFAVNPDPIHAYNGDHIGFGFDKIRIDGIGGAYAELGPGSSMSPMGYFFKSHIGVGMNFWFDNVRFYIPQISGSPINHPQLDLIGTVLHSSVTPPGDPVPEPSTYAMALLGLAGLGGWMRRKRKLAVVEGTAEDTETAA